MPLTQPTPTPAHVITDLQSLDDAHNILLPYQRDWIDDKSRFKIGLWARQTGKDFTCAAEAVLDCDARPSATWIIVAAGERQALESLEKAKVWAEAFKFTVENYIEHRPAPNAALSSAEILFANQSRIIALPARPDTVRGYSANVILTEFAFHDNPREIWRALYPSISNPLRGGEKKLRIISTPNGPGDMFHQLWTKSNFAKHKITIHDAVARGLQIDIDQLRDGLNDPDGWAQEYQCEFLDTGAVLLPYELIETCEDPAASESLFHGANLQSPYVVPSRLPRDGTENLQSEICNSKSLYTGIDFGRHHDRTVCWTLEKLGDIFWTREVLVLHKTPTPEQIEILRPRLKAAQRVCLDYTGSGVGLGDFLAKEFGAHDPAQHRFGKIELCQFTNPLKNELFSKLRMAFEAKKLRIPISTEVREDLHAVRRVTTATGITYKATSNADGHSDRSTALALALRAAGEARPAPHTSRVILPPRMRPRAYRKPLPSRRGL